MVEQDDFPYGQDWARLKEQNAAPPAQVVAPQVPPAPPVRAPRRGQVSYDWVSWVGLAVAAAFFVAFVAPPVAFGPVPSGLYALISMVISGLVWARGRRGRKHRG
jgi:hypothetical protein